MTTKLSKEELGTIVNDLTPDPEVEAVEAAIAELDDCKVTVSFTPAVYESLRRLAEFKPMPLEEYCASVLIEATSQQIGKATVVGPSVLSGIASRTKKITGPSYLN